MKLLFLILLVFWGYSGLDAQTGGWQASGNEVIGTSSSDVIGNQDVKIFPNPVTDKRVNIEVNNQAIQELRITNIAGAVIFAKRFQTPVTKHQIVLENVPNGVYLLRIVSDSNITRTSKLMIRN